MRNFFEKSIAFYEQMDDPGAIANYFALERWINDNIPVAGETFRQFVKKLYQRNELVRGELHFGDRRVDLGRIACPLLLLTASNDHLVAPASTEGIRPHVASRDVTSMAIAAGHVGLVVGGKAHAKFWPEATRWTARAIPTPASGRDAGAVASASASRRGGCQAAAVPVPARRPMARAERSTVWWTTLTSDRRKCTMGIRISGIGGYVPAKT